MFDIDAGHSPTFRLVTDKPRSAADEIADIDGQMEQLLARRAELLLGIGSKVAQAEPIRASASITNNMTITATRGSKEWMNLGRSVARLQTEAAARSVDNDFWTHRHRTMAGISPLIARTTGAITPLLRAAASGEIRDPADALRHERP